MLELAGPGSLSAHYALVTTAGFKAFAGVLGSADDTLIGALVDSVNRTTYRELGCRFILSTGVQFDQVFDGPQTQGGSLWLPNRPLISVTSVAWVQPQGGSTFNTMQTFASTDYQVNLRAGEIIPILVYFPSGLLCLRVVYEAGFATVPTDITEALHSWLMVKYQRIKGGRLDALTIAKETEATTFTVSDMPIACSRVLDGYKYVENNLV